MTNIALVEAQLGGIALVNEEKDQLELRATIGYSQAVPETIKRGEGFIGKVWAKRQIQVVCDYNSWQGRFLNQALDSIHAIVGVPLKIKDKVIGVFFLGYMNPEAQFTQEKVQALEQFARLVSLALHQTKLHTALKNELKIDRSFIQDIDKSVENLSIVQTIIQLAKILCLNVVAEGVETLSQLEYLRQFECNEIQGYYFYKPLPRESAFAELINQRIQ